MQMTRSLLCWLEHPQVHKVMQSFGWYRLVEEGCLCVTLGQPVGKCSSRRGRSSSSGVNARSSRSSSGRGNKSSG